MVRSKQVFQISGIDDIEKKGDLVSGIRRLGAKYRGGSVYREDATHVIVRSVLASEKLLAACAGGKWVVTPEYVLDSVRNGAWLAEEPYVLAFPGLGADQPNPLLTWRDRVARGRVSGAFQGWVVLLEVDDPSRRALFKRVLNAGKAVVYTDQPGSHALTHVLTKPEVHASARHGVPCYPVAHIAKHLFGTACPDLTWSISLPKTSAVRGGNVKEETCEEMEDLTAGDRDGVVTVKSESEEVANDLVLKELEAELSRYISDLEQRKRKLLTVPEFHSYYSPIFSSQTVAVDFSNLHSLIDCGLFPHAVEELQSALLPGILPPAALIQALMQHALHGDAKPHFLSMFGVVLHDILRNNPTWGSAGNVKYFLRILQCPQCKQGAWSFLQTSVRVCLSSPLTCHSQPDPASQELLCFHSNLQAFILRLFQLELHAACSSVRPVGSSRASVLYGMFWNVWERSTLSSRAVQQLAELLVEALPWALPTAQEWRMRVLGTLLELLGVVVDLWCHENSSLNTSLVEKGVEELAQQIAILCQDMSPDILKEFPPSLPSPGLRTALADALYRNACARNGEDVGTEPLSLLKIVSPYLRTLGRLCVCRPVYGMGARRESAHTHSQPGAAHDQGTQTGIGRGCVGGSGLGKENILKGVHRVNAAGETLLHRACKRNQVDKVLQVLALPGIDVNAEDHAGWTPLHEACNHGSSGCVQVLLQHCPALLLHTQVGGVSPLHDALLNGHTDIAKMLLRHAGPSLLQLRDSVGRTPLDLVSSATVRGELQRCASERAQGSEVVDLPFVECCSHLLICVLLGYLTESGVPSYGSPPSPGLALTGPQARALLARAPTPFCRAATRPARLAEDLRTLAGMPGHLQQVCPALTRCQGPNTSLLMQLLLDLQEEGARLLRTTAPEVEVMEEGRVGTR